jgi:hypothetical protein
MVRIAPGRQTSLRWSAASGFAAMLVMGVLGVLGWFWFRPVAGPDWQGALASAAVALAVLLVIVWRSRARAARRWQAALAIYAEREIAKAQRGRTPPAAGRHSDRALAR